MTPDTRVFPATHQTAHYLEASSRQFTRMYLTEADGVKFDPALQISEVRPQDPDSGNGIELLVVSPSNWIMGIGIPELGLGQKPINITVKFL